MNARPESQSVVAIAADVSAGRRSAVAVAEEALARIAASDGAIGAFLEVTAPLALAEARAADARIAAGETLVLAGVPLAIKDNMWVRGRTATCGSKILQGYHPPGDATAIARLRPRSRRAGRAGRRSARARRSPPAAKGPQRPALVSSV